VIGETRLALELLGTRYSDPASVTWLEMMADCVQNQGLIVGPMLADGPDAPLAAFPVTISGATRVLSTHEGRHGDGHPLRRELPVALGDDRLVRGRSRALIETGLHVDAAHIATRHGQIFLCVLDAFLHELVVRERVAESLGLQEEARRSLQHQRT
jgi:hypothetical protein